MQFQFSFKQMDASQSLQEYAESKIREKVEPFVTKPIEAHVTFLVNRHDHVAKCSFTGGDGFSANVEHTSPDMYASVDALVAKVVKVFKKHKDRLKEHKGGKNVRNIAESQRAQTGDRADAIDASDIIKFERSRKRMSAGS